MISSFFTQQARDANIKTQDLIKNKLPEFCFRYFLHIDGTTTELTRLNYARDLNIFFSFICENIKLFADKKPRELTISDLNKLTSLHIEFFLNNMKFYNKDGKQVKNTEQTRSRKLSSIRSLLAYFFSEEKIDSNVAAKVKTPKIAAKDIVRLEADEVVKILDEAENGANLTTKQKGYVNRLGVRDNAILTLLLGTGMRVSECVGLNIADIDFSANAMNITRKGGKTAILYFGDEVYKTLLGWLDFRKAFFEKKDIVDTDGALFIALQQGNYNRMTVRNVQLLTKKYAASAAPLKKITPHKLRSTYGTALYRETKDIYVVADVLGHKDINTTKKHYAALSEDIRKAVANKVKLRD